MAVAVPEVLRSSFLQLGAVDGADMSDVELHESVVALRKHIDQLCAVEASLLQRWDSRRVWASDDSRSPGHRLARETGLSVASGKALVGRARKLSTMPCVSQAFLEGTLSSCRVDLLIRTATSDVASVFARDEEVLVDLVSSLSFRDAGQALKYWQHQADPDGAEEDARFKRNTRRAHCSRSFDDRLALDALFDPLGGEAFIAELEDRCQELFENDWAQAKAIHGDSVCHAHLTRTPSQRRCDALVEMAKRSAAFSAGSQTPKPLITVLVGEDSFKRMCELGSGAVVPPGSVLALLEDADIETIVFNGPRRVMEVTRQRSFRGAVRRAIEVRDRHCQHPSGCDEPARRCQGDHVDPYSRSKTTSERNGQLLCPTHNRLKGPAPPGAG
jgi:hypothetical protein